MIDRPSSFASESGANPEARDDVEHVLVATEVDTLAAQCRRLVTTLFPRAAVEVTAEDGRLVLARLRANPPRFAFVPATLRHLDSLTLLRALEPSLAARVILLVPSTADGYRVAWEALELGAADAFPTPRRGALRIKGDEARWLRRLALLLPDTRATKYEAGGVESEFELPADGQPWVLYPELRQLPLLARALRHAPREVPLVLRVPEGPRVHRVAHEEFDRTLPWPARELIDADVLVPGHLHLFTEPWLLRLEAAGRRHRARLCPPRAARRTIAPRHELLTVLGGSAGGFSFLTGEPLDDEETARVLAADGAPRRILPVERLLEWSARRSERRAA